MDINIYVSESYKYNENKGNYTVVLESNNRTKTLTRTFNNSTNYRIIIHGLIDAISCIKEPSHINAYTTTTFGISRIQKKTVLLKKIILLIKK